MTPYEQGYRTMLVKLGAPNPPPGHPEHVIGEAEDYISPEELAAGRAALEDEPWDRRGLGGLLGGATGLVGGMVAGSRAGGGIPGTMLGLGGAALGGSLGASIGKRLKVPSSQVSDEDLLWDLYSEKLHAGEKAASDINYEDVSRGVAGQRQREDITPEDVARMQQEAYDTTYEGGRRAPLIGGGIGAAAGGLMGGLAGGGGGAALGAGLGGAAGAGLGQLGRWGNAKGEESFAQTAGETARRGRIPYEISAEELQRLVNAYANENQDDLVGDFSSEEYYEEADRQQKRKALEQGLGGALMGNLMSDEDNQFRGTLLGAGAGALSGMGEGRRQAGQQVDLRERGYGHAADMLQRRGVTY